MIRLTRLNSSSVVLNADLIEHIEAAADTIVCLSNGQKMTVRETPEEIVDLVVRFRRLIHEAPVARPGREQ